MPEYRASFDAAVTFSNGGDLAVHGFRVDVPSPEVDQAEIAARGRGEGPRTTIVTQPPRAGGSSSSTTSSEPE
jgi:hypothetical protein